MSAAMVISWLEHSSEWSDISSTTGLCRGCCKRALSKSFTHSMPLMFQMWSSM